MMGELIIEYHALFPETVIKSKVIVIITVRVTDADEIYLISIKNVSGVKGLIYNI